MEEAELIRRACEGDPAPFRRLYDRHVERIYRLCFRMAGEDELAREFTQEAFVRAFQRIGQFRGDAAFSTWLHTIAVSVTLNGMRKVKRVRENEVQLVESLPGGGTSRDIEHDTKRRLHAAIDALPEMYRTVFLMYDLEGYPHEEIARVLDVAVGTSKARLSRARARLREALADIAEEYA